MVSYKTVSNGEILIRTFYGKITIPEIIEIVEQNIIQGKISSIYKGVVNDYRSAEVDASIDSLNEFSVLFDRHIELFKNLKWVMVMDTPVAAFPILFKMRHPSYLVNTFSSLEPAIDWINS